MQQKYACQIRSQSYPITHTNCFLISNVVRYLGVSWTSTREGSTSPFLIMRMRLLSQRRIISVNSGETTSCTQVITSVFSLRYYRKFICFSMNRIIESVIITCIITFCNGLMIPWKKKTIKMFVFKGTFAWKEVPRRCQNPWRII